MNLYTQPGYLRMMDNSLSKPEMMAIRRALLAKTHGEVLEIGIGGGLNLTCYPPWVRRITAVDVYPQMLEMAVERSKKAGIEVDFHPISAEQLPLPSASFNSIISTWCLCSIPNVSQALAEIRRVLKPDGCFYFVEHGLAPDRQVRFWQQCLNPVQMLTAAGCHLNRDIPALLSSAGLMIAELRTFYLKSEPRTHGFTFLGEARKGRKPVVGSLTAYTRRWPKTNGFEFHSAWEILICSLARAAICRSTPAMSAITRHTGRA